MNYQDKVILGDCTLYLGDCLAVMKDMPDKSVDAVITDPPYGLGFEYNFFEDTQDNLRQLVNAMMPEIFRVSKCAVLTPGHTNIWHYPPADWIAAWIYGTTNARNKFGFTSWQPILCYGKDPYLSTGKGARMDIIRDSHVPDRKINHPCPKSIEFMRKFVIRFSANEGDTILDPFMGSGTTGVACVQTGRKFIGIEIDEKYFQIACKRIKDAQQQMRLPL